MGAFYTLLFFPNLSAISSVLLNEKLNFVEDWSKSKSFLWPKWPEVSPKQVIFNHAVHEVINLSKGPSESIFLDKFWPSIYLPKPSKNVYIFRIA